MGLTFPDTPTANQRFTSEGRTFLWNGTVWLLEQESIPWATLDQALAGVSADTVMSPAAMLAALDATPAPVLDVGALRCVAWAVINGTTAALIASRNVASAALVGTGSFSLTFTTPLPSANYLVHATAIISGFSGGLPRTASISQVVAPTAAAVNITTGKTGGSDSVGAVERCDLVHVGVFL